MSTPSNKQTLKDCALPILRDIYQTCHNNCLFMYSKQQLKSWNCGIKSMSKFEDTEIN